VETSAEPKHFKKNPSKNPTADSVPAKISGQEKPSQEEESIKNQGPQVIVTNVHFLFISEYIGKPQGLERRWNSEETKKERIGPNTCEFLICDNMHMFQVKIYHP
jgi:hypothetical protein